MNAIQGVYTLHCSQDWWCSRLLPKTHISHCISTLCIKYWE